MTDFHKQNLCRLGLPFLLVVAVYASTLTHGFIWDDNFIIAKNPLIEHLGNIPQFFLTEDTIEDSTGYYRPVTYISFAVDRAIWGGNPAGYHFTNLVLQICTVLLFYAVVRILFRKERLAFVAALIFALHPVAGETVNFLSGGRNTLLSASFALLSLLFYIRNKQFPALIAFTLAIFSKEFALLLPMVFLLYDYRLRPERIRIVRYVPYLISIACYLALRSAAVQKANFLGAINLQDAASAPYLVVRYALNMLFPFQLKVLYTITTGMVTGVIGSVILVAGLCAVYLFRKHADILFAAFWFLLFLLPVINIIPLHTTTVMADRYAYFSLMGFALLLASIVCRLDGRAATAGMVALCAVYAYIDINRNGIWKNEITFFTRMTKDAPDTFVGFKNLGMAYYNAGNVPRALESMAISSSKPGISPRYLIGNAYVFWREGIPDQAERALLRALELDPTNPEPYLVLIIMHERNGNMERGRFYREKSKGLLYKVDELIANRPVELCRLGEHHLSKKQYADAEVALWQALKINPDYLPALIDMGSLKAERGDVAGALQYLNRVLALDPRNASARYNRAMIFRMQGKFAEAEVEMGRYRETEAVSRQKGGGGLQ